jgi:hypothetical protein
MTLPRTAPEVLSDHVVFEIESIDPTTHSHSPSSTRTPEHLAHRDVADPTATD